MKFLHKSESYLFFFILSLSILWLFLHRIIPIWDGAEMMTAGQKIAESYRTKSFMEILHTMYFDRGWRPIIWPLLSSPVFYIFNNQINLSILIVTTISFSVFSFYCYKIARLYLDVYKSYLTTSFIILIPWIFNVSRDFFPDFLCMTSFTAVGFYFLKTIIKKKILTFTDSFLLILFSFLLFTSRPIMACIFVASFGLAIMFSKNYYLLTLRHFSYIMISGLSFLLLIVIFPLLQKFYDIRFNPSNTSVFIFIILIGLIFSYIDFRKDTYRNFYFLFAISLLLVTLWFYGLRHGLIDWAYTTSFGKLALQTDRRTTGISIYETIKLIAQPYGIYFYLFLSLSFSISAIISYNFIRANLKKYLVVILFFIISFSFIFTLYKLSGTGDMRRIMLPMTLLSIFMTIFIISSKIGIFLKIWRYFLIIGLLVTTLTPLSKEWNGFKMSPLFSYRVPVNIIDPNRKFAGDLVKHLDGSVKYISFHSLCYFDAIAGCSPRGVLWSEPLALTSALQEYRRYVLVHFKNDIGTKEKMLEIFKKSPFTHILIDTFSNPLNINRNIDHMATSEKMNKLHRNGFLKNNFKHVATFKSFGRDFVLYSIPKQ